MYRAHLRCDNGISLVEHLLCEFCAFIFDSLGLCLDVLLGSHFHSRKQAAYSYSDCTEIVNLVNFEKSIKLVVGFEYFSNLVGRYGVKTAAKGVELYKLKVVAF